MRALPLLAPLALAALAACGDNLTYVNDAPSAATVLACAPNLDGVLTADEVPVVLDAQARFRVAAGAVSVNLDGVVGSDGRRRFFFAGSYAGEKLVGISGSKLASRWYSASFPGAEFAAPIDVDGALDGVYSRGTDGLRLHGFASPTEDPSEGKTLMGTESLPSTPHYARPVALYLAPLRSLVAVVDPSPRSRLRRCSIASLSPSSPIASLSSSSSIHLLALAVVVAFVVAHRLALVVVDPSPRSRLRRRSIATHSPRF